MGGGFLIVPLLLFMTDISYAAAVSVSLVVITAVAGVGFISYWWLSPALPITLMMHVSLGGIVGMLLGFMCARYISGTFLQKIFSISLAVMALILWIR